MDEVQEQFDDPALKGAIRRACDKPTAPPRLREKVMAMMASAPAAASLSSAARDVETPSRWRIPMPSPKVAAAAVLAFITVGFAFMQIAREYDLFARFTPPPAPAKFEDAFAMSMVNAHRNCAKLADHHLVGGNDFAALKKELGVKEGIRVFAAPLCNDWQFKGAGICNVGSVQAAHLLFTRDTQSVSVFSIPQADKVCGGHQNYEQLIDSQAIMGFTRDNALYTLVVSRSDGKPAKAKHAKPLLSIVHDEIFECGSEVMEAPKKYAHFTRPAASTTIARP